MLTFIRKNKTVIILLLILIVVIGLNNLTQEKPKPPLNTQIPTRQANYQNLIPGKSSKDEAIEKLGKPIQESDGKLEFVSSSPERPHQVSIQENTVKLIKETITLNDTKRITDIQKEFGKPKYTLYGDRSSAGFHLFIYPENGIAYIGQPESGLLLEVWYFQSTNIEDFKSKFASEYTEDLQQSQ